MKSKYYKRKDYKDKYQDLMCRMEQEYSLFKYQMLSKTAREIYEKCSEIYFYELLKFYNYQY